MIPFSVALQCRFYYYSSLVRPTDQENTDIKMIFTHISQRGCHATAHTAMWGGTRGGQEAKGVRVKDGQEPLMWFQKK